MKDWKSKLKTVFEEADNLSDNLRLRLKKKRGYDKPFKIVPFLGFGTAERFMLGGRVLEDDGFVPSTNADSRWRNLFNTYKRFETDEVPDARLKARFQGVEKEVVADREGYFNLEINPAGALDSRPWQTIELELLEPQTANVETVRAAGQVLVPPATARFGVISDVDDTILNTNVTNKVKMILTVALLNEHTRMPFKGVAAFYRALEKGAGGDEGNPIFYVSSSPWNLYALLVEFLKVHQIPLGPLFLKDFGSHLLFSANEHASHKMNNIERILETYPHLPFVLIGDSGEQDPEIYKAVVEKFPSRIRAIYIRSTVQNPARLAAIDNLIEEVRQTGCQLVLAPDSEFAAVHAAGEGFISTAELANIRSEKKEEETLPSAKEIAEEQN